MFGKIISIEKDILKVENLKGTAEANILNYHVAFEEDNRRIIGEIIAINKEEITIMVVGEIVNNHFISGVIRKPNFNVIPRIIYKSELELILGSQDLSDRRNLLIGKSATYENYYITCPVNEFFSNHFAILGNTGSGKSCGVAKLFQNVFYSSGEVMPVNAHIVMFDVFGEYNTAFTKFNDIPNIYFKSYTTKIELGEGELVKVPAYFLEVDDLALLLNAESESQLPFIEKALKLVYIFVSQDEKALQYKNDIIAAAILDILSSGKNPTQIRDQVMSILSRYNTPDISLETIIEQPGYNRTIRQCLNIDAQGKINAMQFIVEYLEKFTEINLDDIKVQTNFCYSLDDLYYAFEFALISEGGMSSPSVFEKYNSIKVRLHSIINSDNKKYFDVEENIGKNDFVRRLFDKAGESCQIVNMNFNYIDERFAKVLTKVFAKLFYNFVTNLDERASFPIHIVLEEAHRYVQNDNDINVIGYNIFDRITKEGRKYGLLLGFITQRPSELSKTALSQCSNFLVFRMYHPDDISIVSSMSSNVSQDTVEKIKSLKPGNPMVFGSAFSIPFITHLDLPDPMPKSTSVDIADKWY